MQLSASDTQAIVDELNRDERRTQFAALMNAELRADWIRYEDQPLDTAGSELRRVHMRWMDDLLEQLTVSRWADGVEQRPVTFPRQWLTCTDFYFYTGENAEPSRGRDRLLGAGVTLPVCAFKVIDRVFTFDSGSDAWTCRPWLGSEHDPLLRLPYSRKYDRERAQAAETRDALNWERLDRARDLISLFSGRVAGTRVGPHTDKFRFPELDDIQAELKAEHLALGVNDIMGMGGQLWLELLELERDLRGDGPPTMKAAGPALAHGAYNGPLATRRAYFGAASMKRMVLVALDELLERLWELTRPLDEDQDAELAELTERLREQYVGV